MADNSPMTPDELRGLLTPQTAPQAAPAAGQKPSSESMTPDELRGMLVSGSGSSGGAAAPARVGFLEDLGRTAVAKGVQGAAALPGVIGDVASLVGGENKYLPTTADIMKSIKGISPGVETALSYQPDYGVNKYLGSAIEFLPGALIPGGQIGLGARAAGAAGAGLASYGAERYLKGTPVEGTGYQTAAQVAAALAGGLGATGLAKGAGALTAGAIRPEAEAATRLAKTLGSDIQVGGAKGAKLGEIGAGATDVLPIAAGGERTRGLVSRSAERASESAQGKFNAVVGDFQEQAVPNLQSAIDNLFGRPVKAFDEMDAIGQRIKEVNDKNYTRVMALPKAQAIRGPDLNKVMSRLPQGTIEDVLENFRVQGVNPASFGLQKTTSGWQIPPQGANLRFMDEVKQQLDTEIGKFIDPVTKTTKPGAGRSVSNLMQLKSDLTNVLDKKVPAYKDIRFEAAELYGARNAVEAGYKYFSDTTSKNMHSINQRIAKLSPSQKDDLAYGYASAFKDALDKNPARVLGVYGGKKSAFDINKLETALGPDRANNLLGQVNSAYLNSSIKTLVGGGDKGMFSGVGSSAGLGLASGIASEAALVGGNVLQALSFNMSGASLVAALAAGAGKAGYNWKERRVGEKVLELAANPEANQRLGKLIAENQDARSFLAKTYTQIGRIAPAFGTEPPPERPARAFGGRIGSDSKADQLILMADRAKRNIGKSTEMLLDMPDDNVAHALAIANKHI